MARKKWSQLTRAQQHQRARKLSRDPNTRASIPTRYLRGFSGADDLRAERAKNERLDSPFVQGGNLSNRQIARERQAATGLEFGPQETLLGQQRRDSDYHRDTRLPAWFADYQAQLQAGQQQLEAANAAANQQIQNLGAGDANITQQLSPVAAAQAAAASRGATADPGAAQREQDAGRVRQMLNSSFGGMLATQGAANVGRMIDQRTRIVPRQQIAEQQAEQARGARIGDDLTELQKLKGEFATKFMADARDREQRSVLERAAFGLDQEKFKAGVEDDKRRAREQRRSEAEKINQWGYTNSEWRKKTEAERQAIIRRQKREGRASKGKGGKEGKDGRELGRPLQEPKTSLAARQRINQIQRDLQKRGFKSRDEAKAVLHREAPHLFKDPQELDLSAALDLQFDGKLSSRNLHMLRRDGVFITTDGQYWRGGNRGAS